MARHLEKQSSRLERQSKGLGSEVGVCDGVTFSMCYYIAIK